MKLLARRLAFVAVAAAIVAVAGRAEAQERQFESGSIRSAYERILSDTGSDDLALKRLHEYYRFEEDQEAVIPFKVGSSTFTINLFSAVGNIAEAIEFNPVFGELLTNPSVERGQEVGNIAALFFAREAAFISRLVEERRQKIDASEPIEEFEARVSAPSTRRMNLLRDAGVDVDAAVSLVAEKGLFHDIDPVAGFGRVESNTPSRTALLRAINTWILGDCNNLSLLRSENAGAAFSGLTGAARIEHGQCRYSSAMGADVSYYVASVIHFACEPAGAGASCVTVIRMGSEISMRGDIGQMPGLQRQLDILNPAAGLLIGPMELSLLRDASGRWLLDPSTHGRSLNDKPKP